MSSEDFEGGLADKYPSMAAPEIQVAPTTKTGFNTIRQSLIPIACWRLHDMRFEFDSSFVRAEVAREMGILHKLLLDHPRAPLSVFGHADPVGDDEYNKQLSGRRSAAIYGLLKLARYSSIFASSSPKCARIFASSSPNK